MKLDTIQSDIATLPPEAQKTIADFISFLKQRYHPGKTDPPIEGTVAQTQPEDWADFIGCVEAEPDLSRNYKTYLGEDLGKKG